MLSHFSFLLLRYPKPSEKTLQPRGVSAPHAEALPAQTWFVPLVTRPAPAQRERLWGRPRNQAAPAAQQQGTRGKVSFVKINTSEARKYGKHVQSSTAKTPTTPKALTQIGIQTVGPREGQASLWGAGAQRAISPGNAAEAPLSRDVTAPTWAEGAVLLFPARMVIKYRQVKPCLSFRDVAKLKLAVRKERFSSPRHAKQGQCWKVASYVLAWCEISSTLYFFLYMKTSLKHSGSYPTKIWATL